MLKTFYQITKNEKNAIKIKPIKVGKQSGTTYCFGCKDYSKHFRSEKVKMINKVLREKSHLLFVNLINQGF